MKEKEGDHFLTLRIREEKKVHEWRPVVYIKSRTT